MSSSKRKLERRHEVYPAGDGFYGTRFLWIVSGPQGATQFMLRVSREHTLEAWDLGFHWKRDPGYATRMEECDVLPEGECWYDGSSLNAERVFDAFKAEGEEAVWKELEEFYDYVAKDALEEFARAENV